MHRLSIIIVATLAAVLSAAVLIVGCGGSKVSPAPSSTSTPPVASPVSTPDAIVVGEHGTVLTTTDGGEHWIIRNPGTKHPLGDVALSGASAWATDGDGNGVFATTDGGLTWSFHNLGANLNDLYPGSVASSDPAHVWVTANDATGFRSRIFGSTDGGQTWVEQYKGTKDWEINDIAFSDSLHGWAVGDHGILATTDGGTHWRVQWRGPEWPPKGTHGMFGVVFFNVACDDSKHVWAVGGWGAGAGHSLIMATSDGGKTWRIPPAKDNGGWDGVASNGPTRATAIIGNVTYATSDGGAHWTQHYIVGKTVRSSFEAWRIAFSDARHGWIVGSKDIYLKRFDGVIYATANGGVSWKRQLTVRGRDLSGIAVNSSLP